MKRVHIAMGIFLLMSGTTLWAQSEAAKELEARKLSELRAQSDAAKEADARKNSENARREAEKVLEQLAIQQPFLPQIVQGVQGPGTYSFGQNQVRVYADTRTNDPLATLQIAPGSWWNNPTTATTLGLTKDQQKKMDDIFQQNRLRLIDLNAALSKEEAILEPLMAAERLDEPKILVQIDKIAQARAELEKANSRMLLGIRQTLTMDQWNKVQTQGNSRLFLRK